MNAKQRLAIRLILALAMGCGVAWLPLNMGRGSWVTQFSREQMATQQSLKRIVFVVEDYNKQRGVYPTELQSLLPVGLDDLDGWGRPWIYSLAGGKPLVKSLGRDGQRGGSGEDADLSNLAPRPDAAQLSAWQRWTHPAARGLTATALLVATLMATLTFFGLKDQTFERKTLLTLLLALFSAFVLAAFGAAFIAIAHIPSGH